MHGKLSRGLFASLYLVVFLSGCFATSGPHASVAPDGTPAMSMDPGLPASVANATSDLQDEQVQAARGLLVEPFETIVLGKVLANAARLAAQGDGTRLALAVAKDGQVTVRISEDAGRTWSAGVNATGAGAAPAQTYGYVEPLQVAWGKGDNLFVAYTSTDQMFLAASRDAGKTFEPAKAVTFPPTGSSDHYGSMGASQGTDRVVVTWLRSDGAQSGSGAGARPGRGYMAVSSEDGGKTWGPATKFPGDNVPCDCCGSATALRDDGTAFVIWRNVYDPGPDQTRDYVLSVSQSGATWSEPQRLEPSGYKLSGCPETVPSMRVGPDGRVTATWWTGVAGGSGFHVGTIAPGSILLQHTQALSNLPSAASSAARDGLGNTWALMMDYTSNPPNVRLALQRPGGSFQNLGLFKGRLWPDAVGTPEGFVAVMVDDPARNVTMLRGSMPLSAAVLDVSATRGPAPLTVNVTLKAVGGPHQPWTFDDGHGNVTTGDELPPTFPVVYPMTGLFTMRFKVGSGASAAETSQAIEVVRRYAVPDQLVFSGGPLSSCAYMYTGYCASLSAGPDRAPADGFWTKLDERYWGLIATVEGDVSTVQDDPNGHALFLDSSLKLIPRAAPHVGGQGVPDGTVWAFTFGPGPGPYAQLRLHFALPADAA